MHRKTHQHSTGQQRPLTETLTGGGAASERHPPCRGRLGEASPPPTRASAAAPCSAAGRFTRNRSFYLHPSHPTPTLLGEQKSYFTSVACLPAFRMAVRRWSSEAVPVMTTCCAATSASTVCTPGTFTSAPLRAFAQPLQAIGTRITVFADMVVCGRGALLAWGVTNWVVIFDVYGLDKGLGPSAE